MSEAVDIFQVLKDLNILYEKQEHKAIFPKKIQKMLLLPWKERT